MRWVITFGFVFIISLSVSLYFLMNPNLSVVYPDVGQVEEDNFEPLSIERVFAQDHLWVATLSAENVRTLRVSGDVIPARSVNFETLKRSDILWPYREVSEYMKDSDLTYINLETPLLDLCPITNEGMLFCGDSGHIQGLVSMGVDVANIANNHVGNHGAEGVEETIKHLADVGIGSAGTRDIYYRDVDGLKFAFLGYNDIEVQALVNSADEELIARQVEEASQNADVVVVQFHWGAEYMSQPGVRQRELAHLAVDHGADLVIGNHPHWVQPVEIYRDGFITYAHGNFIFDQMWSEETREGVVGTYTFYRDKLIDVRFRPLVIYDYGQPRWDDGARGALIIDKMRRESETLRSLP